MFSYPLPPQISIYVVPKIRFAIALAYSSIRLRNASARPSNIAVMIATSIVSIASSSLKKRFHSSNFSQTSPIIIIAGASTTKINAKKTINVGIKSFVLNFAPDSFAWSHRISQHSLDCCINVPTKSAPPFFMLFEMTVVNFIISFTLHLRPNVSIASTSPIPFCIS